MKKTIKFLTAHKWQMLSMLLFVLAVVTGGAGVCMAADPVDPVDPNANDLGSPDGGAGQDLTGTQASGTQARLGELVEPEYDPDVVHFRCHKYVLLTDARTLAQQRTCTGYEVTHWRIGDEEMSGKITAQINASSDNAIVLNKQNFEGNLRLLIPGTTLACIGVPGYADGSQTKKDGGDLVLYVESTVPGVSATCRAINGPATVDGEYDDTLDSMSCPQIAQNTIVSINSVAGAESQQEVTPDNAQPRPKTVYLQKQILNVVITDHYKQLLKKTPWAEKDIKAEALRKFQQKAENTLWTGRQKRWKQPQGDNLGEEFVYTSEGVLRQVTNYVGLDGKLDFEDVTALQKIQFTEFSEHDEAEAYCGKDKIEEIVNMDFTRHKDITYVQKKTDLGIVVRSLVSNFGTFNIKYAPALDKLGYRNFMVILDMKGARYYTNITKRERTNDMKKDGNGGREASRYIYIEAGALALRGYNSILAGPSAEIANKNLSREAKPVTIVNELPATPYDGMRIVLNNDIEAGGVTYDAENIYVYTASTGRWTVESGTV